MKRVLRYFLDHVLCYSLLLSLSIFGLLLFIWIWLSPTSYVYIGEPDVAIRIAETVFFVALILWSFRQIYKKIKGAN